MFFRAALLTGSLPTLGATCASAQTPTGNIGSTVLDTSSAAIPNATVTIRNVGTNITQTVRTGASLATMWIQLLLLPGDYNVKVAAQGLAPAAENDVVVDVSAEHPVNFSLKVGSVSQTATVQATTPALQTTSAATQTVITGKKMLRPFPQYNGVTEYRKDSAYANYNSVVAGSRSGFPTAALC